MYWLSSFHPDWLKMSENSRNMSVVNSGILTEKVLELGSCNESSLYFTLALCVFLSVFKNVCIN